ncbi:MAG: sulfite exporter TauE/SafE family protein [Promethearchaeota archaeon]
MLFMPLSIFVFGFPLKDAVVISLFSMTGLNISASIRYMKMRLINYRLSILYNLWDFPGVIVGAWITSLITQNILAGICGALIITLSLLLFRKNNKHNLEGNPSSNYEKNDNNNGKLGVKSPVIASISSFSGGFISGLGGVGGGTADTTTMILLGLDPKEAAATSEFAMIFTSVSGVLIHMLFGTYNGSFLWPIIMTLGAVIGAQIGSYFSTKMESKKIRQILAVFAFYTGILLILLMFDIGWGM